MIWPSDEYFWAIKKTKEMEIQEHLRTRTASRTTREQTGNHTPRVWHWRVEPEMEDAFRDLRRWFLPHGGIEDDTATAQTEAQTPPACAPVRCCW